MESAPTSARELPRAVPSFAEVYGEHARFVWRVLRRMGVREADCEDACQEAFVVIHRKLPGFDGRGALRSWLFAIAVRVASDFRKRAHVRREVATDEPPEGVSNQTQADALDRARARALLDQILDSIDDEKRAVFVLYELESMTMSEVAEVVGCPLQTAYSRLHTARKLVQAAIDRYQRSERA